MDLFNYIDCKCYNQDCKLSIWSPKGIGFLIPFDVYKEGVFCEECKKPLKGEPEKAVEDLSWELMIPIDRSKG
jgi:hypothetical protein